MKKINKLNTILIKPLLLWAFIGNIGLITNAILNFGQTIFKLRDIFWIIVCAILIIPVTILPIIGVNSIIFRNIQNDSSLKIHKRLLEIETFLFILMFILFGEPIYSAFCILSHGIIGHVYIVIKTRKVQIG